MKRRSFFFLPLWVVLSTGTVRASLLPEKSEKPDEPSYEDYLHYWCPTATMIESARQARTRAKVLYKVIPAEEWDV